MALLVIGVAVPTPGAVGGFHEAFRIGVTTFFGAPNDAAVGAAIVLHAFSFVPVAAARACSSRRRTGLNLGRHAAAGRSAREQDGRRNP